MAEFLERLRKLPVGYSQGDYQGRPYGVTLSISDDRKRWKLFAEELGGADIVSFNLYFLSNGDARLKPCEIPEQKAKAFVLGYRPLNGGES